MEAKLRILMQNENLTASRLAEILDIKPAAVSHILKGRNKPSFELVCKLVNRFPQINPYWLLGDSEEMYNKEVGNVRPTGGPTLFDIVDAKSTESEKSDTPNSSHSLPLASSSSEIEKIIIIYRDQTFEELRPKK